MKRTIAVLLIAVLSAASLFALTSTEAENRAVAHVNLSREDVRFGYTERDRDDGRYIWEVTFFNGRTEYEFDIDDATGSVLEYKVDYHLFRR